LGDIGVPENKIFQPFHLTVAQFAKLHPALPEPVFVGERRANLLVVHDFERESFQRKIIAGEEHSFPRQFSGRRLMVLVGEADSPHADPDYSAQLPMDDIDFSARDKTGQVPPQPPGLRQGQNREAGQLPERTPPLGGAVSMATRIRITLPDRFLQGEINREIHRIFIPPHDRSSFVYRVFIGLRPTPGPILTNWIDK
jgi:hypothetical protein